MAKFEKIDNTKGQYQFYCPGCKSHHGVWTASEGYPHPVWSFNGNLENPTVSPSIKVTYPYAGKVNICHSFVKDGKIQFLSDCTHELAGTTIELPDID